MTRNRNAATTVAVTAMPNNHNAKVAEEKDIRKVWRYFSLYVGTTLDAAKATGILRNSITYYVADLERMDMLQAICIRPDRTTGYKAKHYSADRSLWHKTDKPQQLDLFAEPKSVGQAMHDLTHATLWDERSGEFNIMAAWAARKEAHNGK